MTDLMPFDFGSGSCRFGVDDDGTPWVVASDFAKLMGHRDAEKATRLLDEAERGTRIVGTSESDGRVANRPVSVIFEDGIWELIFRSTLPGAKAIKTRVKAVLREIRETGRYGLPALPRTFAEALRELASSVEARELAEQRAAELEPAAHSWTTLADAGGDYSLRQAAQILDRDPAISTGQNRLAAYLRGIGWLDSGGEPYQRHVDTGRLVRRATSGYDHPDRGHVATWQVRVTAKGLHELHRLLDGSGPLLLAARPERSAS